MNAQTANNECAEQQSIMKYFCVHCCDVSNQWNLYHAFDSVEGVYDHWFANHTNLSISKPFLFYALELVGCHYCTYFGLYNRLRTHHANNHPTESLVITRQSNREQCALCFYTGSDLINHLSHTHELVMKTDIFNPICFTRNTLAELLAIDVHRKRQCGYCGLTFDTDSEAQQHHGFMHWDREMAIIEWSDEKPNQISYLICGTCHWPITPNDYFAHIEMDQRIFQTTVHSAYDAAAQEKCSAQDIHYKLYQDYLKTKVVFRNGLILFKQNLIFSEFDDIQQFNVVVNEIIESVRFGGGGCLKCE